MIKLEKELIMRHRYIYFVLMIAILFLAATAWAFIIPAFDFDVKVTPRAGAVRTIKIQNFTFNPQTLTAKLNDTVRAVNNDGVPHTITSDAGLFDSGIISSGKSKQGLAKRRGTFSYHCTIHPFMKGTILVQ